MICPKCGKDNKPEVKFCTGCGMQLAGMETPVVNPVPNVEQNPVQQPVEASQPAVEAEPAQPVNNVEPVPVEQPAPVQPTEPVNSYAQPTEVSQVPNQGYAQPTGVPVTPNPTYPQQPNMGQVPNQVYPGQTPVYNNMGVQPKKNKTPIIIACVVVGLIVLGLVGSFIFKKIKGSGDKVVEETFKATDLIRIQENDKYGYINLDGKKVIKPIYDKATDFYGNFAIVQDDKGTHLIDKKGKVKMDVDRNNYERINEYDVWVINGILYDGNLKQISPKGVAVDYQKGGYFDYISEKERGIMNYKGKKTYKSPYSINDYFSIIDVGTETVGKDKTNNYCNVTLRNEKYAIINCETGKVVYDYTDYYIGHSSSEGTRFRISNHSTYKTVDSIVISHDKIVFSDKEDNYSYYSYGTYMAIRKSGETKYLDYTTGKLTDKEPKVAVDVIALDNWEDVTGLKKFSCSDGYGVIKDKDIKVACEWKSIKYPGVTLAKYLKTKGKVYVFGIKDDKYHVINAENGKVITEFNTTSISDSDSSIFISYTDKKSKKVVVYNILTNKSVQLDADSRITKKNDYFIVTTDDGTENYYNSKLKKFYSHKK